MNIENIIFDLGGVLIDWNPRYLYRKIFSSEDEMEHFLRHIATSEWNAEQDAGRSLKEGTEWLVQRFPQHKEAIEAYYGRWEEMLGGEIKASVDIFYRLKAMRTYRLYALTNWSAETFIIARQRFSFLQDFDGIVVSGEEKTRKPFPEIYQRLAQRFQILPERSLFIDDVPENIDGARQVGFHTLLFISPQALEQELKSMGILKG
ncbi:MAG: HAD family phosphatase [Thermoflavifilum aggregans]|nr:HAD family phosphatase [Thermoflavifilum aggregans]